MGSLVLCGTVVEGDEARAVAKEAVRALIRLISEDEYHSGWLIDIEHVLWDRVVKWADLGDGKKPTTLALAMLAEQSGHWWHWQDGTEERAVLLEEWVPMHEAWRKKWEEGAAARQAVDAMLDEFFES